MGSTVWVDDAGALSSSFTEDFTSSVDSRALLDEQALLLGTDQDFQIQFNNGLDRLEFSNSVGTNLVSISKSGTIELIQQAVLPDTTIQSEDDNIYGGLTYHNGSLYILEATS